MLDDSRHVRLTEPGSAKNLDLLQEPLPGQLVHSPHRAPEPPSGLRPGNQDIRYTGSELCG